MIKLDYLPYYPSPNKSVRAGGAKPTWIVLHAMSGYYGTPKSGTIGWFLNPKSKVSAHYLVSRKGEVCCVVKDSFAAWHTKNFNSVSLGIEMEDMIPGVKGNCLTNPQWYTLDQLKKVAELVATLMLKHNIPFDRVIDHSNPMLKKAPYFNDHRDVGDFFPWIQFKELVTSYIKESNEKGNRPPIKTTPPLQTLEEN